MTPQRSLASIEGRCAVVTGGASGIGLEVTRTFCARGARVVVLDIDPKSPEILSGLDGVVASVGSVTAPEDIARAFDLAEERFGPIDVVFANAGLSQSCPTLDLDLAAWRRVMSVNLDGAFLTAREAGRRMIPRGRGRIILTSSIYGVVAAPERAGYVVSKTGVVALAKVLATEWAAHGVRVNAIAPGYVETPLVEGLVARGRIDIEAIEKRTPIRRLIEPAEVAELAAFLASEASGPITGQAIAIDGGWTAYGYV